jgi:hypothetical protein
MSERIFELGDIDEGGMEALAKGWSVGPFLLRGEGGMIEPLYVWGEGWSFWAGGGDEAF